MCTSVASRVQGTTGEPCSSWPWWLRMMCSTAAASSDGKPGQVLDQPAHAVVAERDLALELAEVGHVDRQRVGRVGVELADVVQQRAGDRDVAVHAAERRADRRHALGDGQLVLEQPVPVGLVEALGGRRLAELLPRSPCPARTRAPAARAGARTGPSRSARAGRPPSARPRNPRAVEQIVEVVLARLGVPHGAHVEPPARLHAPATRTHAPGAIWHGAASSVPVRSPSTSAPPRELARAHHQDLVDLLPGVSSRTRTAGEP